MKADYRRGTIFIERTKVAGGGGGWAAVVVPVALAVAVAVWRRRCWQLGVAAASASVAAWWGWRRQNNSGHTDAAVTKFLAVPNIWELFWRV